MFTSADTAEIESLLDESDLKSPGFLNDDVVRRMCEYISHNKNGSNSVNLKIKCIQFVSYCVLGDIVTKEISDLSATTVDSVLSKNIDDKDIIMDGLIANIQNLLYKPSNSFANVRSKSLGSGLNPKLGFNRTDETNLEQWKLNGGLYSIPLLHVILRHLDRKHFSSNIWWITPAILNLLDDTSDLHKIKLKGVKALQTLLKYPFCSLPNGKESQWISFEQTGLFGIFEPILVNMTYFLPPSYPAKETCIIYESIFPALILLYKRQYENNEVQYKTCLQKLLSDNILTNIFPRIVSEHESLTLTTIKFTNQLINELKENITILLSRFIFVLGEYFVKNPFFTTSIAIVEETIKLISLLINFAPIERLNCHKYDFTALLIIIYEKNDLEGTLDSDLLDKLKTTWDSLIDKKCGLDKNEMEQLLKSRNNLEQLLN
ncbi:hypothetical protein TPHA_0B00360 [Tetrapisispora phaffii CBS 4417]|uniref:TEL2-interacting protein 2 n=1 Tax=Tetrapisispora phaffii (strain ATCC 24235 / CBS 4417 / NBRC 1672 / NRRL Y-8282 / UCD 70-5) TaxID=1071381 RepID=G8BQB1_TETPH|nr:hypothetical protein TPHA_0B00360 [Tetrapisispora phaffii CBS 4417]CCE61708.1 hypothetical protein TPHA_0B00360 [Tetrapisispora phaffii CBS 4417]